MFHALWEFIWFIIVVVFWLGVTAVAIPMLKFIYEVTQIWRRRLLAQAPKQYDEARVALAGHLVDCRAILVAERGHGSSLRWGTAFGRTRSKSLRLLKQARGAINRLYKNDPDHARYIAKEQLEQLYSCCMDCVDSNRENDSPVCNALAITDTVFVDLHFQRKESDVETQVQETVPA